MKHYLCSVCQGLTVQVEEVRIRATYSHRKRIPITEGFLEVKDGGKWRQICNEDWNQMNSRVICGMQGFPGEKRFNTRPYKWVMLLGSALGFKQFQLDVMKKLDLS